MITGTSFARAAARCYNPDMVTVSDYNELADLPVREGVEVLVASSSFVYRGSRGRWLFVQRLPGCRRSMRRSSAATRQLTLSLRL